MAQKIEEQFPLFSQMVDLEKGRSHSASFAMKETNQALLVSRPKQGDHAYFKYEVKITTKEAESVYKSVVLSVDRIDEGWRVTQFDESASEPTETVR